MNIFYPLKDSRSLLFSKFPSESLNPSRSFLKCFIIFTSYPYSLLYFFYFYLFPGILEFWCLATVTFKVTVVVQKYRKKYVYIFGIPLLINLFTSLIDLGNIHFFFLSGFFFMDTDGSLESRGRVGGEGGGHLLFHSTTSTRSRTFRHFFVTLRVRWLSHIFNRTACITRQILDEIHHIELPFDWLRGC